MVGLGLASEGRKGGSHSFIDYIDIEKKRSVGFQQEKGNFDLNRRISARSSPGVRL